MSFIEMERDKAHQYRMAIKPWFCKYILREWK